MADLFSSIQRASAQQPHDPSARLRVRFRPGQEIRLWVKGMTEAIKTRVPDDPQAARDFITGGGLERAMQQKFQEAQGFLNTIYAGLTPEERLAVATMGVPGLGDVTGLAADMGMYIRDPESRTLINGMLSTWGALGSAAAISPAQRRIAEKVAENVGNFRRRIQRLEEAGVDTNQAWFHGSTHNIEKFDNVDLSNYESHFGAKTYLTSSPDDASRHYASTEGPDLTNRITQRAEQIAGENDWDYDDARALKQATEEIAGENLGVVYPVYTKTENPFDISSDGNTFLNYEQPMRDPSEYLDEAEATTSFSRADFDTDDEWREHLLEGAEDLARDDSYNFEPEGQLADFLNALANDPRADDSKYAVIDAIREEAYDGGISGSRLDEIMRNTEWWSEGDTGEIMNNEVYRNALEQAGFDSIIHDADIFSGMDIEPGTKHQIVFRPENIYGKFSGGDL